MKKHSALFAMIASAIFVVMGAIVLLVLTADGPMQLQGVALGAGFGFWLALGFLIGRAVYGERKNMLGLMAFMLMALVAGLIYHLGWQLPYISAHPSVTGFLEQICGMIWALGFAAVYLSYKDYRRAEG